MKYIIMLMAAAAGGVLQGCAGFGYSLICMSLYVLVIPVQTALALQPLVGFFVIGCYAIKQFKYINFRLLIIPVISALPTTYLGIEIAYMVDAILMKKILGVALVVIVLISMLKNNDKAKFKNGIIGMIAIGSISGLFGGLTNIYGPPMAMYFSKVAKDKNEYNGTIQAFFLVMTIFKTIINMSNTRITMEIVKLLPILIIATAIGLFFGFRLLRKMKMEAVRKMVNIVIAFMGMYLIIF